MNIFTDGSVLWDKTSECGFVVYRQVKVVAQNARTIFTTTESKEKKIKAITKALSWLVRQDATHAVVVTDSQSKLRNLERGVPRHELF